MTELALQNLPESPSNLQQLLFWIYGRGLLDSSTISSRHRDNPQTRDRLLADHEESLRVTRERALHYAEYDNLIHLFSTLSPLEVSLVVMFRGLNGRHVTFRGVREVHQLTSKEAHSALDEALRKLRASEYESLAGYDQSLELPIEVLELSTLVRNTLRRAQIFTIRQLVGFTARELRGLNWIGRSSLRTIEQKLAEHGLSLKQ